MSPFMKSSNHFMFFIIIIINICFCSLSINARANNAGQHDLINVPLPVFKRSLEKSMGAVQNVASTMSNMHNVDDIGDGGRTAQNAISYCGDLLGSTAQVLNWSLSTIYDLKGDVVSHMTTLLNSSQSSQATCVSAFAFGNGTKKSVAKRLKQVTNLIHELLGMIKVQENPQNDEPLVLSAGTKNSENSNGINVSQAVPNATVSQDGSGKFLRIMDAVGAAPSHSQQRFVIFVKRGVFKEYVKIDPTKANLVLIGEGMNLTIISGDRSNATGYPTDDTATFVVKADGFVAMNIGFENTAGPQNMQAIALLSAGDRSVFYRCKISGYQDTLFVQHGRQFYRECTISGTIDFVFGYGTAIFQSCTILAKKNNQGAQNTLTANGRFAQDSSGFSFQFCDIRADSDLAGNVNSTPTYLGRPWGNYSRTVFLKSSISNVIQPEGWLAWRGYGGLDTLYYAEYMNNGPGASVAGRVKWPGYHVITEASGADPFTVAKFIDGNSWLPSVGVPYAPGLESV